MRLIEVNTLLLKHFDESEVPRYGILSHTWEDEEVTFQDFEGASMAEKQSSTRYHKIRGTAALALKDDLEYMWIDTCCIDKSSSADLQEAINSMYRWYANSWMCYVYLSDHERGELNLTGTRWITRAWTLQELIAPTAIDFYAKDWSFLDTKVDSANHLAEATGIAKGVLHSTQKLDDYCVAQKMNWAAKRQCKRVEDKAYSLMGLFGINMPMLYGEGERAFIRLQEEIIRTTYDMSIFAWTNPEDDGRTYCGLLCPSPEFFASCTHVHVLKSFEPLPPYSMTNLGMQLQTTLSPIESESGLYLLPLMNVYGRIKPDAPWSYIGLHVKALATGSVYFARVDSHEFLSSEELRRRANSGPIPPSTQVFFSQTPGVSPAHATRRLATIDLHMKLPQMAEAGPFLVQPNCEVIRVWPPESWTQVDETMAVRLYLDRAENSRFVVWFTLPHGVWNDRRVRTLVLELEPNGSPRLSVCIGHDHDVPNSGWEDDAGVSIGYIFGCRGHLLRSDGQWSDFVNSDGTKSSVAALHRVYMDQGRVGVEINVLSPT